MTNATMGGAEPVQRRPEPREPKLGREEAQDPGFATLLAGLWPPATTPSLQAAPPAAQGPSGSPAAKQAMPKAASGPSVAAASSKLLPLAVALRRDASTGEGQTAEQLQPNEQPAGTTAGAATKPGTEATQPQAQPLSARPLGFTTLLGDQLKASPDKGILSTDTAHPQQAGAPAGDRDAPRLGLGLQSAAKGALRLLGSNGEAMAAPAVTPPDASVATVVAGQLAARGGPDAASAEPAPLDAKPTLTEEEAPVSRGPSRAEPKGEGAPVLARAEGARGADVVQPPSKVEEPAAPRVIHEVAEKTALAVRAGKNRVEVVLDPPQLGRVHVQVATEAGRIQARIEATTEATRALLESRISQLTQAFEGAGLPVQGVSVSLHMDMNSQMLDQQPRGGTASYQHEDGRPAASEEAPDPARPNRSAVLGFSYLA